MCVAAVAVTLFAVAVGQGEVDHPLVRAGVAAYESLEYAEAVSLLERARSETLTDRERAVTLELLGSARAVLGETAAARADFTALLRLVPGFTMDDGVSPRIRVVFEQVRAEVRAAEAEAAAREAEKAKVTTAPPDDDAKPLAHLEVTTTREPDLTAAPVEETPVYREGWFWGVVGGTVGVAAVVGVAIALATRSTDGTLVVVAH